ncbi:uncharacterized protein [Rutidosis leptorrhynchoides]|uniref:uncharacterized protein n=1 Tax=Rutidosis leptorrhynchoides TaxID=125765 RepID=UPI003A9A5B99
MSSEVVSSVHLLVYKFSLSIPNHLMLSVNRKIVLSSVEDEAVFEAFDEGYFGIGRGVCDLGVIVREEIKHTSEENILKHLKIQRSAIFLATSNFNKAYISRLGDDHREYLAELEYFDQENSAYVDENNRSEPPKKRTLVKIKRLFNIRHGQEREDQERKDLFTKEILVLSTCKHPNILNLLGFCDDDSEMIIVYENKISEYLDTYLMNKEKPNFTWAKRLRICLDVAYGLEYLHYGVDQAIIIHRDIRCGTIILDENLGARIANLCKCVYLLPYRDENNLYLDTLIGSYGYMDPEYRKMKMRKLKRESDIYSFGVVMCELFCGKLADESDFTESGLAYELRRCFHEGTVTNMVDPIIKEESSGNFTLNRGPNTNSLDAFLKITVACLEETQDKRPTIKVVIEELKKALKFQENNQEALRISLNEIQLATNNFHDNNCVGGGGFGKVYIGKLPLSDYTVVAKRLDTTGGQGDKQFRNELQILFEYKHDNIISLVGYCDEKDTKVIVYEYAIRGSLDRYLNDSRLTWIKRLKICIDVATALDFLHRGTRTLATVIHRDIKPDNILLTRDWNAKLADFGLSLISAINNETDFVFNHACGTEGYVDPLYLKSRFLTKKSDIYSFGVVLFEILCGRSTFQVRKEKGVYVPIFIKDRFEKGKGKHDDVVFEEIKEQIMPEALSVFHTIAYRCLNQKRED